MTQPREFTALANPLKSCLVNQGLEEFVCSLLDNNELN